MEAAPKNIDWDALHNDLLNLPTVSEVHDLHIWSLSTKQVALSAHLVAEKNILKEAQALIFDKYKIHHMTLQIDTQKDFDAKYCFDVVE